MLPRSKPTVWGHTLGLIGLAAVAAIDAFNLSLDFSAFREERKKKLFKGDGGGGEMWGKKMKIEVKGNQGWWWRPPHQRCIVTRHSYRSTYTCVCVCVCAMDSTLEFIPEFVMGWISNLSIVSEMMASYLPLVRNFGLLTRGLPSWSSKGVNIRELDPDLLKPQKNKRICFKKGRSGSFLPRFLVQEGWCCCCCFTLDVICRKKWDPSFLAGWWIWRWPFFFFLG